MLNILRLDLAWQWIIILRGLYVVESIYVSQYLFRSTLPRYCY